MSAERFGELARRVIARASRALARSERAGRGPQPVEMIPGMPAAPEPCTLPAAHWTAETHPKHAIAQPKIDGIRALYLQHRIVTREAQPFNAALHCLPALVRLEERFGQAMVFDGEYQERGGYEATQSAFRRGEGEGIFWLFDAVPYAEWKVDRFTMSLEKRLAITEAIMPADEPFLAFLPPVDVHLARDVLALVEQAWAAGAEGLVIKSALDPYFRGRSRGWLKLKRDITVDVPVLDVAMRELGVLATARVLVRVEGKSIWIAAMPAHLKQMVVGDEMGVSEAERLTGRIVEITYERTDKGTLRAARIVRLRPDKETTS
jgi:ATP-dependent DNA ligase